MQHFGEDVKIFFQKREKKPAFEFSIIKEAVYEEPLIHHGYGFDFMIVNK